MHNFELIVLLMAAAILLVAAAQEMEIPYPIALVIGGAAIGFTPGVQLVEIDPNLILIAVVPPILYYGAFWIPLREFKKYFPHIFSLALGLVIATTVVLALLFKWLFPTTPWPLAFAFGAILSPPDAVAAISVLKRFTISPRLMTVLEGESLVNDATALVLYRFALAALVAGSFSWADASVEFVKITIGGIMVGLGFGLLLNYFSIKILSPVLGVIFSLVVPYITYFIADWLRLSGVLAVVANGLIVSRIFVKHYSSARRLLGVTIWDIFIVLLNCFVFILIGLQLAAISQRMTRDEMFLYTGYGILVTTVMIAVRMLWVYLEHGFLNTLSAKGRSHRKQFLKESAILGWSGMRGIISLTAVLTIPQTLPHNGVLVGRDVVIFITFIAILLTLLIPGLTLPYLINWLRLKYPHNKNHLTDKRKQLLDTAEKEINFLEELDESQRAFLLNYFKTRHYLVQISSSMEQQQGKLELARRKILNSQRNTLLKMWEHKEIDDRLLKALELELDLEEALSMKVEIK